jgi:hypothetical protein
MERDSSFAMTGFRIFRKSNNLGRDLFRQMARCGLISLPVKIPVCHGTAKRAREIEPLLIMTGMIGVSQVVRRQGPDSPDALLDVLLAAHDGQGCRLTSNTPSKWGVLFTKPMRTASYEMPHMAIAR